MNSLTDMSNLPLWPAIWLAIGFPVCLLILNECINAFERRGNPLAGNLRTLRTFVLPALAVLLFVRWILELPSDHVAVRWTETIFWIALLYALLGVINDTNLFGQNTQVAALTIQPSTPTAQTGGAGTN